MICLHSDIRIKWFGATVRKVEDFLVWEKVSGRRLQQYDTLSTSWWAGKMLRFSSLNPQGYQDRTSVREPSQRKIKSGWSRKSKAARCQIPDWDNDLNGRCSSKLFIEDKVKESTNSILLLVSFVPSVVESSTYIAWDELGKLQSWVFLHTIDTSYL